MLKYEEKKIVSDTNMIKLRNLTPLLKKREQTKKKS